MRSKRHWTTLVIALAVGMLLGVALCIVADRAHAHDWYPFECCSGQDCGPATMTTVAGATFYAGQSVPTNAPAFVSTVTVTFTAKGVEGTKETVVVPDNFPRRVSPDGRMHACIYAGRLQCLFMPPAM